MGSGCSDGCGMAIYWNDMIRYHWLRGCFRYSPAEFDRRRYQKCRRLIAVALDLDDDRVFVEAILCRSPEATRIQSNLTLPKMNPRAGCRSCAQRSEALLPGQVRGADVNSMCSECPHSALPVRATAPRPRTRSRLLWADCRPHTRHGRATALRTFRSFASQTMQLQHDNGGARSCSKLNSASRRRSRKRSLKAASSRGI